MHVGGILARRSAGRSLSARLDAGLRALHWGIHPVSCGGFPNASSRCAFTDVVLLMRQGSAPTATRGTLAAFGLVGPRNWTG